MIGPELNSPEGDDPDIDYVPSAQVLATLPSRNPNGPDPGNESTGVQEDVDVPGPVQRAACMSDIRILRGLLRHGFPPANFIVGPLHGPWESALTNAINARLPQHVELLLQHGANPNGFPDECYLAASTRFVRGRDPATTITGGCYLRGRVEALESVKARGYTALYIDQAMPLSEAELQQRRQSRARFWAEPDFPMVHWPTNNPSSSLAAAVAVQNKELYGLLLRYGADESAWRAHRGEGHVLDSVDSPSRWAVEPPLWIAIQQRDITMLDFLLTRGHKPHHFPEALVTRSWNAFMYAVSTRWTAGFEMMCQKGDLTVTTPVFRCHLVHFAVATLDMALVQHVMAALGGEEKLRDIPNTALGHTLLHVASLPLDDSMIDLQVQAVKSSIHEFNILDTEWRPKELPVRSTTRGRGSRSRGLCRGGQRGDQSSNRSPASHDTPWSQRAAQGEVIRYLLQRLSAEEVLTQQDVHGNTPMHYLACISNPDQPLLLEIRRHPGGIQAWSSIRNSWGFTAKDLLDAGEDAKSNRTVQ